MSNAGQAILSIAGAAVGFIVGGPTGAAYGFQLGYLAGTALFPTQLPHLQGPRLGDGQQTTSVVGQPIPLIFGTQTVGGNIIWASPIREVANEQTQGGKGGPEQSTTTYTYFRSWAILLCEGPIGGVRRIWANGKLVYSQRAQVEPPDPSDADGIAGARAEAIQQVAFNEQLGNKMTIYVGTEDQLPDPVIESFEGAGNVSGMRGYAYVVFDDVELKPEDGNRIPSSWKFEVYEEGTADDFNADEYSNEVIYAWNSNAPVSKDPRNPVNVHRYQLQGVASVIGPLIELPGPWRTSLDAAIGDMLDYFGNSSTHSSDLIGWSVSVSSDFWCSNLRPVIDDALPADRAVAYMHFNEAAMGGGFLGFFPQLNFVSGPLGQDCGACILAGGLQAFGTNSLWWGDRYIGHPNPEENELTNEIFLGVYTWTEYPDLTSGRQEFNNNCTDPEFIITDQNLVLTPDVIIKVERIPQPPPDPAVVGTPILGIDDWYVWQGSLMRGGEWEEVSGTFHVLQSYEVVEIPSIVRYPLNPCLPLGHSLYDNEEYWTDQYNAAVAKGLIRSGLVYGVGYPDTQAFAYKKANELDTVETAPVSLASIVRRICERAGEKAGFTSFDVSDLENEYIIGYQVSRPMTARAAIEPLRSVGFFDVVESGETLKFITRGKPTVAQLTNDDIGCHMAGEERPPSITTRKKQEFEMPRQVRVHFQNPDRDYDPGEELSPARFDTKAESVVDVDVGAALDSDKAAQIAEVLYRDFWASRWSHDTQVDQSWSFIEPADCIEVPIDGRYERVRVPAIVEKLPNLRTFEMVRDDDGSYESLAVGTDSLQIPSRINFYGPVELELLDLPPLSAEYNDAGIYAAIRPAILDGAFRGAVISRSPDGGNYEIIGSVTVADEFGLVAVALQSGPTTIFDEGNELIIEMYYGELESRTQADVLAGANAAAIGDHGRWEIVQFKNAELVGANTWRLTGLLRGRRGSEHAVGSSVIGDRFVMLSTGALARLSLTTANIGIERLYKATPIGNSPEAVEAEAFTGAGEALKPFSPVHLHGGRDSSGNLSIAWVRRDRLATDLDVPMSEAVEDYEVDILTSEDEVIRTISVSESEALYSEEQQLTDFGIAQPSLTVRVYQISQAVGRGYPAQATL